MTCRIIAMWTQCSAAWPIFDAIIATAHNLGIKVLIDLVLSHSSDQHPWFKESRSSRDNPRANWYVWADPKPDGTPPNNWLSIFRWVRLGMGRDAPAILPAQFPDLAARSELSRTGGAAGIAGCHALLAGARGRWLPSGHDQFLCPRLPAARQPTLAARATQTRILHPR